MILCSVRARRHCECLCYVQSGGAAWFNRVQSMDVGSSIFVANSAVQECGALEMNQCTGNVHDSIFSWNKVQRV